MLLNTKCERCNEPTKHVVGFWDGENGKSGFVHDCENEKCEVRQQPCRKDSESRICTAEKECTQGT